MFDLGDLGGADSYANAINSFGQVVGASYTTELKHAFLFTGTPGVDAMIDLDAWFDQTYPAQAAKWTLFEAYDISDTGLILGQGYYDDGTTGTCTFVLDASSLLPAATPEPASLALLAPTALLVLRRRRRQHS